MAHITHRSRPLSPDATLFIAGHRGMVGSAIVRRLQQQGYGNILTRSHAELDLTDQQAVGTFFQNHQIDHVVLAAARVGGILANNTYPAEFIYQNLMIEANVIHGAYQAGVTGLLFLGSSCIYPKLCPQPMREEYLLSGYLESTNEPYAIAKIAGIKMCESYNRQYGTSYRSVMPTNLYGPGDNYHLENSHVLPAMIRKYHLAKLAMAGDLAAIRNDEATYGHIPADIKEAIGLSADSQTLGKPLAAGKPCVKLWGTGTARREFLHVDDMAAACVHLMGLSEDEAQGDASFPAMGFVNIGTGKDSTIREVAELVREVVGFTGETIYDSTKPDGTPRKLLDTSRITSLGWQPSFSLREGVRDAYSHYLKQLGDD